MIWENGKMILHSTQNCQETSKAYDYQVLVRENKFFWKFWDIFNNSNGIRYACRYQLYSCVKIRVMRRLFKDGTLINIRWVKPSLVVAMLGLLVWLSPSSPIDPWHLVNPKKIATMIFALAFIQILGSVMNIFLGARTGAILTGFFGGLVSSTATTVTLARKSKVRSGLNSYSEMISFLSATGAMLIEGATLVWMGESNIHFSTLAPFLGPLLATVIMIYLYSRKLTDKYTEFEDIQFHILPVLKLSAFIVSILLLSKLLQNFFGQSGLMILTSLVSLFEIHGSVIANVQLHENSVISAGLLSSLLAISIVASYLSKFFLISTLGTKHLRSHAMRCTLIIFISILITYLIPRWLGFLVVGDV